MELEGAPDDEDPPTQVPLIEKQPLVRLMPLKAVVVPLPSRLREYIVDEARLAVSAYKLVVEAVVLKSEVVVAKVANKPWKSDDVAVLVAV